MEQPLRLSASAVKAYEACPYKYARDYVDRLPQQEREPVQSFAFGNTIHAVIASFIRKGGWSKVTRQELTDMLFQQWDRLLLDDKPSELRERQRSQALLDVFYFNRFPRTVERELGMELWLNWARPHRGILASGKLDRVCLLQDRTLQVIDYKTGRAPAKEKLANDAQVVFYRSLAGEAYADLAPERTIVSFYHLQDGKEVCFELTPEEFHERWAPIEATAVKIREAKTRFQEGHPLWVAFPLRRGYGCASCPMRGHCDRLVSETGTGKKGESDEPRGVEGLGGQAPAPEPHL